MRQRVPAWYDRFSCPPGGCEDNCCIGWDIVIDPQTLAFYTAQPEPWRSRFAREIDRSGADAVFRMDPQGRCPFLDADHLCQIYTAFGPEHLCAICAQHPRFHNRYGGRLESGLGLACLPAAQLALSAPAPALFVERQVPDDLLGPAGEPADAPDGALLAALECARDTCFALLAGKGHTAGQTLALCAALLQDVQRSLDRDRPQMVEALCKAYAQAKGQGHVLAALGQLSAPELRKEAAEALVDAVIGCEPLAPAWPQRLARAKEAAGALAGPVVPDGPFYANLAGSLFYRYLLESVWDRAPAFWGMKAIAFCVLTALLEHAEAPGDFVAQARLVKDVSKELEYCPDNLDALAAAPFRSPALGLSGLVSLLM